jgi:hypothetical protein
MLKIKKEHIGKRILKGSEVIVLSEDLSQLKLAYIRKFISDDFIEEFDEFEVEKKIAKKQAKKYVEDSEEPVE